MYRCMEGGGGGKGCHLPLPQKIIRKKVYESLKFGADVFFPLLK